MPVFKIVVSEPKTRKSHQFEVDQDKTPMLMGKKIGDEFDGDPIGLKGYKLEIRGGTDKDGFPMHPNLKGQRKKKLLLSDKPGFHPLVKGQRKRKMVRGNTVSSDIVQLNVKVIKAGTESLEKLAPKKESEEKKTEEKPKEEKPKETEKKEPEKKTEKKAEKKEEMKKEEPKKEEKPKTEEKPKEPEKKTEVKKEEQKPTETPKEEKKVEEKKEPTKEAKEETKQDTTGGGEVKE